MTDQADVPGGKPPGGICPKCNYRGDHYCYPPDVPGGVELPLGHEYDECQRYHGRKNEHSCWAFAHCSETHCGQPRSAHQPPAQEMKWGCHCGGVGPTATTVVCKPGCPNETPAPEEEKAAAVHACGDEGCIVPHPPAGRKPPSPPTEPAEKRVGNRTREEWLRAAWHPGDGPYIALIDAAFSAEARVQQLEADHAVVCVEAVNSLRRRVQRLEEEILQLRSK